MDDIRNRFLRDRVLTASPAQRVVMLYDRLALDLTRARTLDDPAPHLQHATQIVAELLGSLDASAGGPAENLAALYHYLMRELLAAQLRREAGGLDVVAEIVATLGQAWAAVASGSGAGSEARTGTDPAPAAPALASFEATA